jgi:hypothetical protein
MLLATVALLSVAAVWSATAETTAMSGFTAADAVTQRSLEQRFDAQLSASDLRE